MADLNENIARRFSALFAGFRNRYGSYEITPGISGKQKGIAKTLPGPIFPAHYVDHLAMRNGIGVIPLLDDNQSASFGCIDVDKYPVDFAKLEKDTSNLPVVLTKSKSGGAHIWLFTLEPVPATLIQNTLKVWAAALGFGKSEIFPKQTGRMSADDAGNWINLPYFGHTRAAFFNGKEQTLEAFLDFAERRRMNAQTLEHMIQKVNEQPLFSDGPPCLATLTEKGIGPGTRNVFLLNVGTYFKKKDPGNFQANLLAYNKEHMVEPLPESEIQNSIIKSLQRKSYGYQCSTEPLCSACNRTLCLKREFGVGGGAEELDVELTGLTKINTDPPIWYINIDGVRIEIEEISALINQNTFRTLAAQAIHKLFSMIKRGAWEKVVNELLAHVEVIEAPEDSSFGGQLGDEIREFVGQFSQEEGYEQILAHTVYVDREKEHAYFRSNDLLKRIKKNLGNPATAQRAWAYLKSQNDFDAAVLTKVICNRQVKLWRISTKFIFVPTSALTPPKSVEKAASETPF